MRSAVSRDDMATAIESVDAGLDALLHGGVEPVDARDAVRCLDELERLRRRLDAVQVEVMAEVHDRCLHVADGHRSVKVMACHVGNLSNGEAAARDRVRRVLAGLPLVRAAYRSGDIGTDHVRTLARTWANPRVRDRMVERQGVFLEQASCAHRDFDRRVRRWERLVDDDGAPPPSDPSHERRNATIVQEFNGSFTLAGTYGSIQGATMREILDHYVDAETLADWEKARAEHGPEATAQHLPRSGSQRRADALWQLFQDAAANPNGASPPTYVHNIVWSAEAFEEHLRRAAGGVPMATDPDRFTCRTANGFELDPTEAIASAFVSKVRRVVLDAAGTVIDLGRARLFTGSARLAVMLPHTECVWAGCSVPVSACEADHVHDHAGGGCTHPGNGAPLCGRHNRWKQKGFHLWRDPAGEWHTVRPDGTLV